MIRYGSFSGFITMIDDFWTGDEETRGCYKMMTVQDMEGGIVNFVVTPSTYFVNHVMMGIGDWVIGFYDLDAPVPAIYPPQYRALVMAKLRPGLSIKVDYFNSELVSSDGTLKLNIGPWTRIILENGQIFTESPANHTLIVLYGPVTRSIPAQTTPYKIIVLCDRDLE
ncbi:hypothetical protein [Dehalobacterium formicoaceticum]|uniref:Uncharacterized protein n=1 Tax=Dehalobacterium formicoaceticum TaxID=51515 RepID=A0ABT1Y067_9FIRM|nr:hypothetical protein [Dehalobacterium formicoaceticum]MCR6544251.1 hypothetical protein [Dehalobacterium formicoaceticum]